LERSFNVKKTKYKPVAMKKKQVPTPLKGGSIPYDRGSKDCELNKTHNEPENVIEMIKSKAKPASRKRITPERLNGMFVGTEDSLSKSEKEPLQNILIANEMAFSFTLDEIGLISDEIAEPYMIRNVEHTPIQKKPFPIPRGIVP
jgi:hypothetical protein